VRERKGCTGEGGAAARLTFAPQSLDQSLAAGEWRDDADRERAARVSVARGQSTYF
jgi:hypothetical protein